jgi:hypothetical protein
MVIDDESLNLLSDLVGKFIFGLASLYTVYFIKSDQNFDQ